MKAQDTANVIASIALGVSVLALIVSGLTARRQNRLQARLVAIEEERRMEEVEAQQRADVVVTASPVDHGGRGSLELTNRGPAVARGVELDISSTSDAPLPAVFDLEQLPVDLQPGASMSFPVAASMGETRSIKAVVRWADDAGHPEMTYPLSLS